MLRINNLRKLFAGSTVLDDITLSVTKSSIVGLAGPSGGGKSTLLRCIQKLEKHESGFIELEGRAAFMFQDFQLFPHMTVLQNLIYAPNINDKKSDHSKRAYDILNTLGITSKANESPQHLSGGQKQRVALARSLMINPDILLCDEPTSGLDVATILDVVALLQSVRDMGVTMVIASHDLDFLTKISDRIVLLKAGKIVIDLDPKTLKEPISYLKNYY